MAIAAIPQNLDVSQGNRQISLRWGAVTGALSYSVQRSSDGVTYSFLASSVTPFYVDATAVVGTMYWYQVASVNGSGTSGYSDPVQMVAAPNGEASLYELRLRSKQKADRVNSDFVVDSEWDYFIDLARNELYNLLVDVYEDYFMAPIAKFTTGNNQATFPLPDGALTFTGEDGNPFVAPPFFKLLGVDLGINSTQNANVTVNKFNLMDRNRFVFPNSASTIYGVFNLQYRILDRNIRFIPTPTSNQVIGLWYIPKLKKLILDNDVTIEGGTGWLHYVITRAAKYALDKEEQDTQKLDGELIFLKGQIEDSSMNRDAGQPDRITDVRQNGLWGPGSGGWGFNGPIGGL